MKIGVAIIACDRSQYTDQCIPNILAYKNEYDTLVVVNDGIETIRPREGCKIINNNPPYQTVGVAKNKAIEELLAQGCDKIFLIENDILIKKPGVFQHYIETANATGIMHLNFGYHGPANRTPDYSQPRPRYIVEYSKEVKVALNTHSVGAFSYFDKKFIELVGLHDLYFRNAWEHVELCQRAIKKGLLPAFWWFPDVANSHEYLEEIPGSINNSSITHTKEWTANMQRGAEYYKKLYGRIPIHTPDTPLERVLENLKKIYKSYKCT